MRTQVMPDSVIGTAWLDQDRPGGATERTPISSLPFTIGRQESCSLQVDSHQVSREHAVITRQGKKYRLRDLNSTNGTFVNGEQIEEITLNDGDLLVIADVEFTFFCETPSGQTNQAATQVLSHKRQDTRDTVWDLIRAVRRTHEAVTRGGVRTRYQPIIKLADGETFGYEAFAASGTHEAPQSRCEAWAGTIECRAADRLRRLFRRLAVEDAARLPRSGRLFLAITAAESAEPSLISHLCQLRDSIGKTRQLVVEIPDNAARSSADFRALLSCLRDVQIQVAYDEYASGKARITEHKDITPDFLKLASSMLRSVHQGAERQRQLQLIVRASHDLGCTVIATGVDSEQDLRVCRDLGCTLAQGALYGEPQGVSSLIRASRAPLATREAAK